MFAVDFIAPNHYLISLSSTTTLEDWHAAQRIVAQSTLQHGAENLVLIFEFDKDLMVPLASPSQMREFFEGSLAVARHIYIFPQIAQQSWFMMCRYMARAFLPQEIYYVKNRQEAFAMANITV